MVEKNSDTPDSELIKSKFEFEKYKYKVEILKWFIGSVALVLVTALINYGFKDREAGLNEIQQYDKYVTELIILNKDIGQKRMLAQFFAHVTPSEKLKKGWLSYYKEVDIEYQKLIAPILKSDAIAKDKYYALKSNQELLTSEEKTELVHLRKQIEDNEKIINPDIILPSKNNSNYTDALQWEQEGFSFLLNKDVNNAILAFRNSENAYNQFHQVYEIAQYLSQNRRRLSTTDAPFWDTAFRKIATDFSWEMPSEVREQLANPNE